MPDSPDMKVRLEYGRDHNRHSTTTEDVSVLYVVDGNGTEWTIYADGHGGLTLSPQTSSFKDIHLIPLHRQTIRITTA